jgi:hypothetical protein
MERLPTSILYEILLYLDIGDIFTSISLLNKSYLSLVNSPIFLNSYTKTRFHITIPAFFPDYSALQIIKANSNSDRLSREIQFKGLASSGGVYYNRVIWWVHNLFINDGSAYCTNENVYNVNTAAVLLAAYSETCADKLMLYQRIARIVRTSQIIREFMKHRCSDGEHQLNTYELKCFTDLQVNPALLRDLEASYEEELKRMVEIQQLYNALGDDYIKFDRLIKGKNAMTLSEHFDQQCLDSSTYLCIIHGVTFSRKGNYTCPVGSIVMFCSDKYIDVSDSAFVNYDDIKSLDDIDNLHLREYEFPKVNKILSNDHFTAALFDWRAQDQLRPMIWLKFNSLECTEIEVDLLQVFSGRYLYVKMIEPDIKYDRDDPNWHTPNIDATYAGVRGTLLKLDYN